MKSKIYKVTLGSWCGDDEFQNIASTNVLAETVRDALDKCRAFIVAQETDAKKGEEFFVEEVMLLAVADN
jgi:hypothetical protein